MFISLRYKFILSLLLTSMLSTLLVAGVAYTRLVHKFDDIVLQSALKSFRDDVIAYIRTYGSWQEAQRHEDFPSFSDRRRQKSGLPLIRGLDPADRATEVKKLDMEPVAPNMPPLPGENLRRPPFRFYLFDPQWRALLPLEPYHIGETIHADTHKTVLPIEADGRILAYYSPEGRAYYSDLDLGYLAAIREAMLYGAVAATLLTLVLDLALGNRLSASLRRLTSAIKAMEQGKLKQQVVIDSRDEVGVLAKALNDMSGELARSHEELRQAHEQVRRQAEQLKELSMRDGLTNLHNRRFFDEQADALFNQAVRCQQSFSVMIGDIDFFKQINDVFSHAMGDEVLLRLGEILLSQVRAVDVVARYGGEEFVIAFPQLPPQQALIVCENLLKRIEEYPWHELHPNLTVTMSMGLCGNTNAASLGAMLMMADALMYRAKSSGRNRVCSNIENFTAAKATADVHE